MSKQEIYAWTSLLSSIAIIAIYSITVFGWPEGMPDIEVELRNLFIKIFLFAIGVEILLGILKRKQEIEKSERDEKVAGKGFRNAYIFLSVAVASILFQTIMDQMFGDALFVYGIFSLIHTLLFALFISSMVNRITQIYYYRYYRKI